MRNAGADGPLGVNDNLDGAGMRPVSPANDGPPVAHDPDSICWCCSGPTAKRHCKIVCTNCGFMRDCSDP